MAAKILQQRRNLLAALIVMEFANLFMACPLAAAMPFVLVHR
eukprot:CAMPEP_0172716538 /NCGR_PEP_ID=MMETSP1074-20121228/68710_1 /TAXON_ID=2916 /ORGANISM="Ceratium fusus, Strain PA161109" /LENGTH=41 /DNA_ID= /DNA_START= /DNA_END= /DNA_ORIENTATION=